MEHDDQQEPIAPPDTRRLKRIGLVVATLAAAIVAMGVGMRFHGQQSVTQWSKSQALPTVSLVHFTGGTTGDSISLPGNIQAFNKAAIYARVSGYLKSWQTDIGSPVKAGQLLAVIDAPDLDQQYAQAKANLMMDQVNERLALLTAQRWQALLAQNAIARQDADTKTAAADAAKAVTAAARANLEQLAAMESFKNVRAPFDGIVTARTTDIGALINAGNSGQQLFEVSDLRSVRIYVQVPQMMSGQISMGMQATFVLPQYPGRQFRATVASLSHAMDTASKSMLVELHAENPDSTLFSDAYCQVHFLLAPLPNRLLLPVTAIIQSNQGSQVAVLEKNNHVALKPVQIGRDLGDSVEVTAGLSPQDKVINSPPETIQTGNMVRVANASQS
ncbi:MAG TPA: efflux RND transporter periplasmic adaptor subunit [Rhizomicrobium sp.]|nr:efflux RND transporter periplasmic adaptor subunit [Rhizomicrobium sp.]